MLFAFCWYSVFSVAASSCRCPACSICSSMRSCSSFSLSSASLGVSAKAKKATGNQSAASVRAAPF